MKKNLSIRAVVLGFVAVAALAAAPRFAGDVLSGADSQTSVREIHLVVRDMTFYVDGDNTPNPTLYARPGERLRIVLRNTDVGMSHDFVIRSWHVGTRLLKGKGEDRVELSVPNTRGVHFYSCSPHSEMMGGTIVVN
jgi:plastocyanin